MERGFFLLQAEFPTARYLLKINSRLAALSISGPPQEDSQPTTARKPITGPGSVASETVVKPWR
jgi:hypothetical protein